MHVEGAVWSGTDNHRRSPGVTLSALKGLITARLSKDGLQCPTAPHTAQDMQDMRSVLRKLPRVVVPVLSPVDMVDAELAGVVVKVRKPPPRPAEFE